MLGKEKLSLEINQLWQLTGQVNTKFDYDKNLDVSKQVQLSNWLESNFKGKQRENLIKILAICNLEISELQQKYTELTLKSLQTKYRKEISKITGITNNKQIPLCLFQIDSDIIHKNNDDYRIKINQQNNNLDGKIIIKRDTIDKLINHCKELINSDKIENKAIALALFTGRRIYQEIYYKVEFLKISDNEIRFFNLAKKPDKRYYVDSEIIGFNSDKIISELNNVRNYIINRQWYSDNLDSEVFKSKFSRQVTDTFNKEIKTLLFKCEPDNLTLKNITPHKLRALFISILIDIYKPDYDLLNHFKSQRLGHYSLSKNVIDNYDYKDLNKSFFKDSCYVPNLIVSESYNVFKIIE